VGEDRIFATLPTAVAAFARWHRSEYGVLPPGIPEAMTAPEKKEER
jgi:SulP family sulfate permease